MADAKEEHKPIDYGANSFMRWLKRNGYNLDTVVDEESKLRFIEATPPTKKYNQTKEYELTVEGIVKSIWAKGDLYSHLLLDDYIFLMDNRDFLGVKSVYPSRLYRKGTRAHDEHAVALNQDEVVKIFSLFGDEFRVTIWSGYHALGKYILENNNWETFAELLRNKENATHNGGKVQYNDNFSSVGIETQLEKAYLNFSNRYSEGKRFQFKLGKVQRPFTLRASEDADFDLSELTPIQIQSDGSFRTKYHSGQILYKEEPIVLFGEVIPAKIIGFKVDTSHGPIGLWTPAELPQTLTQKIERTTKHPVEWTKMGDYVQFPYPYFEMPHRR